MNLIGIAAIGQGNRVMGVDNTLLWKLPEDLRRFKRLTEGHIVVMGRKTWESLGEKPLSNRVNLVISNSLKPNSTFKVGEVGFGMHAKGMIDIAKSVFPQKLVYVIGGAKLFESVFHHITKLELTEVFGYWQGDTYFPEYEHLFTPVAKEDWITHRYITLERNA